MLIDISTNSSYNIGYQQTKRNTMDIDLIIEGLARQTPLLNNLDPDEIISVLKCCKSHSYTNTEIIYAEGSKGSDLFIVLQGAVTIKKNGQAVDIMRIGDCFGEVGAVSSETRLYTAEAYGDVVTLGIHGEAIDTLDPQTHITVLKNILVIISDRYSKRIS
jgi:CRP-like cAMP-binding protein